MFIGYLHISNNLAWSCHGLGNLFLVPCEKASDHAYMFDAEANSKQQGGAEAGSGELGSSPSIANHLDKSQSQLSVTESTTLLDSHYVWFPYNPSRCLRLCLSMFCIFYYIYLCVVNCVCVYIPYEPDNPWKLGVSFYHMNAGD